MKVLTDTCTESAVLHLSKEKFVWATTGQFDKLAELYDDDLIIMLPDEQTITKAGWIGQLKTGRLVYNTIDQKEAFANANSSSAVVLGRAKFTVNGTSIYHLVYTEIYARKKDKWKLVNIDMTTG